ncbi:D-arabinose 5-phosphate [Oceanicola sp. 22II-s10i]|uniref:KpsF/GutQ family sugar-phosphate isomerase n=1 Tax=Oceanicola sp. 22II-s10i TaxID=1317116 RepID=UPI000B524794|nr:KpsF/GutQ family sugar-phosphate isomerase [Oceanicola sp. 22II-s10i]OWU82258.1 D-arabinose 5-phosphate [Oceanicola sp. 22II-s10i]
MNIASDLTRLTEAATAAAQRVLQIESDAIRALAAAIPEDFSRVIDVILASRGRVILSGIGKSGHIARKISSTLASTGTPSFFVHAAEASHGDLGMVTADDVCILISNSGETSELGDIIAHTRRFAIPMAAISSRPDSTLMRAADYRLPLPPAPEACLIGMAPTTSTVLTMALGDALAVALMEQRGFVREQFRTLHPGGKLGAQLATVGQLMHGAGEIPIVSPDTSMGDTLLSMTTRGFGIACVVEDGRLMGVISDGDLRRAMDGLMDKTAGQVATRTPKVVPPEMLAAEAMRVMNQGKVTTLVVTDAQEAPVGILRIHDCLRAGVA